MIRPWIAFLTACLLVPCAFAKTKPQQKPCVPQKQPPPKQSTQCVKPAVAQKVNSMNSNSHVVDTTSKSKPIGAAQPSAMQQLQSMGGGYRSTDRVFENSKGQVSGINTTVKPAPVQVPQKTPTKK